MIAFVYYRRWKKNIIACFLEDLLPFLMNCKHGAVFPVAFGRTTYEASPPSAPVTKQRTSYTRQKTEAGVGHTQLY